MDKVFLTGLSGSGKSTLARMLAARVGRDWIDTDSEVVKAAGMPITEIFRLHGESKFRKLEAETVRAACRIRRAIIATGGGAVLLEANVNAMRESGIILWLNRPIDAILADLDTAARPLLKDTAAFLHMAEQRLPIYMARCDIEYINAGTAEEAVHDIINMLNL